MKIFNFFKQDNSLSKELDLLPRETKKRILENVIKRKNEILEEKLLEQQLKQLKTNNNTNSGSRWSNFKEGMKKRREELRKKGILKPIIRYNKDTFRSSLEEMSIKSRNNEIKRLEEQRLRLKNGHSLNFNKQFKAPKKLKLKSPKINLINKKGKKKNGFI